MDPLARITVEERHHTRIDTPVSISLEGLDVPLDAGLRLVEVRGQDRLPVPSQIDGAVSPRLWWILSGTTKADRGRVYELERGEGVEGRGVEAVWDEEALEILVGGERVLRYHHAPVPPPEGKPEVFTRSAFVHPLWSPAGAELTRMHPEDHIHHMGLWNPWTKTEFEGRKVDFWNLGEGQGTVRFVRYLSRIKGPVFGGFRALHEHVDLTAPGRGGKAALNEVWDVRAWNLGGKGRGGWLVDFTFTQSCASASPLKVLKYRYGGFGFRATAAWDEGDYLTSEGKTRKDGQGTRARWCMVYGPTAEGPAGIVFMSHPHNHAHPEPMRIWSHTDPIFFSFCPTQQADWVIEPGRDIVLKYRLYIYEDTVDPEDADRLWNDFGYPPRVRVDWNP